MKIVVISLRSEDHAPEEFEPYLAAEAKTVLGFMADDFVRELYSIPEGRGAVAIVEAAREAEAREKQEEHNSLVPLEYGMVLFSGHFRFDL